MSEEPKGTPVTQEWVLTLLLGYFLGGPIVVLAAVGLTYLAKVWWP